MPFTTTPQCTTAGLSHLHSFQTKLADKKIQAHYTSTSSVIQDTDFNIQLLVYKSLGSSVPKHMSKKLNAYYMKYFVIWKT